MVKDQKIIKARVGLLELARQLGKVSEACKIMGIPETPSTDTRSCSIKEVNTLSKTSPKASPSSRTGSIRQSKRLFAS